MNSLQLITFLTLLVICTSQGQFPPMTTLYKPGSCPPLLPRLVCYDSCSMDNQCPTNEKCCRTSCGGTVCSRAVSARTNMGLVKQGSCPAVVKGPWQCSSTCFSDGDCRAKLKCCKNRCGASVCANPII